MQATEDGEFYPEKDLDKNYRIPRRPASQQAGRNFHNSGSSSHAQANASQTPLANSYYNYPYDPSAASAYYQNYSQYYQQYGQAYNNTGNKSNNSNFYQEYNANYSNRKSTSSNGEASSTPKNQFYSYNGYTKDTQNRNNKVAYYSGGNTNANDNASNLAGSARNFGNPPPPPPPPPGTGVEPIKQNIYNALKDIKEKPKNYNKNYFQNTVPDLQDETLPKDLKILFQPLFCKLCSAQLSSNQTAKMHYKSKNHEKQIRKWLIAYSEKTGEPLPKRARVSTEKLNEDAEKNPTWFHCDVCDLDLTGKLHAESHYMGKSHQKAIMGWKAPAGQGYYDDTGKWVRTKGQKSKSYNFENGEDNFGNAFKTVPQGSTSEDGGPSPAKKRKEAQPPQKFHCDVCDINTTCQEQLDNHFRGQKHMKKLKQHGMNKYSEQRDLIDQAGQVSYVPSTPSIVESTHSLHDKDINLSVYRTPSGDYYCPTCNITSNSDAQFVQHMKSKNHAKKAAQKKAGSN